MPTDKRQRQKEGRRVRLEARRKVERRRTLVRRVGVVVAVSVVLVFVVWRLQGGSSSPTTTTTTTSSTLVQQVTPAEIAATKRVNAQVAAIVAKQQKLTASERAAAQSHANAIAVAAGCPASPATRVNTLHWPTAPKLTISLSDTYRAVFTTDLGKFTVALNADAAPITVNNFVFLAKHGYYHCVIFHRVIPLFMDQSGDPTGTGSGGPGYTITDENPVKASNPLYQYPPGSLAMANTGAPNSGGSQFFIVVGPSGESLPNSYALFGQVIKGFTVAATLNGQGSAAGVPPDVTHRILSVTIIKGPPK